MCTAPYSRAPTYRSPVMNPNNEAMHAKSGVAHQDHVLLQVLGNSHVQAPVPGKQE